MHLAIITRQIGHYHAARFRGASEIFDALTVISAANEGDFAEFLARDVSGYSVERLFEGRAAYAAAVREGAIRPAVGAALGKAAPDVIAVSGWVSPESLAAIRWARSRNVPIVVMSESQADDAERSILREAVKKRIIGLCQAALVGGPPHANYITRLGIPRERVHLGYNAVDNVHFAAGADDARANAGRLREEHGLPGRYVLASARFIDKKNLPTLVMAYATAVAGQCDSPDLVILGDGPEKGKILAAASAAGVVDRLHLPGFRSYDVLPHYYGLADAFAHVSRIEQWGLVVNEAMASAVPVIVSDRCGVARTVVDNGVTGYLVAPEIGPIAAALQRVISMPDDLRIAMGTAARAAITDWGPERFGTGMKAAVLDAKKARSRRRPAPWDAAILRVLSRRTVERVA
jgi:1,2-diacylglycerol 3-alpha-glucosyltransferase